MDFEALKPGGGNTNPPAEPAYSAPHVKDPAEEGSEIVLPEENDEPDVFDEEAGVDDELADLADFDTDETNPKEVSE